LGGSQIARNCDGDRMRIRRTLLRESGLRARD
jgi:hypothetical protein